MNSTFDDEMRRVYAPLERDHERLRDELMASLPETPPRVQDDAPPVSGRHGMGWSIVKRRMLPASLGIAAVVALVIGFWPGHERSSLAWADVVRQIKAARTAHLRTVTRDPQGKEETSDVYIQAPDRIRMEKGDPATPDGRIILVNGTRSFLLNPAEKTYEITTGFQRDRAGLEDCLALLGAFPLEPGGPGPQSRPVRLGDEQMRLSYVGAQERDGRKMHKYRLAPADPPEHIPAEDQTLIYCWFDPARDQVALITYNRRIGGKLTEVGRIDVALNMELPDGLFSVPPGYTETARSIAARGFEDGVDRYEQARNRIARYRLIAWENQTGKAYNPMARVARDGNRWRADDVFTLRSYPEIPQDFEAVWSRFSPNPNGVSVYGDGKKKARILWDDKNKIHNLSWGDDPNLLDYMLAGLGWPEWPVSLESMAMDRKTTYRRLAERTDRPGMIGIEYRQLPNSAQYPGRLTVFWLDPAKDYLCTHYEDHRRYGSPWQDKPNWTPDEPVLAEQPQQGSSEHDSSREIVEFGRTPDGHWYPQAVKRNGATVIKGERWLWRPVVTRVQVDFAGPIAGELFELPAEAREYNK